jgi:sugar lactone lactonase YvrE
MSKDLEDRKALSPPGMLTLPTDVTRLPNGNTLITDGGDWAGFGSEVVEVDPAGKIVWIFEEGLIFAHSAKLTARGNILISDTTNNRIIEVNREGKLVWTSESWRGGLGTLSDGSRFDYPNDAEETPEGRILISDRNNDRIIEFDREGRIFWVYDRLQRPHNADRLPNGNTMVADSEANIVKEIDPQGKIVWSYGDGSAKNLHWPRDADRLPNGNTLIADSKNHRILEVDKRGKAIWAYYIPHRSHPYEADLLENGNILISDQFFHAAVEVDRAGNVIWLFRNFRRVKPIPAQLLNPGFEEEAYRGAGYPKGWWICNLISEGGGNAFWDSRTVYSGKRSIALDYDRGGSIWWQQTVQVKGGRPYKLSAYIKTQDVENFAQVQLAFVDGMGGYLQELKALPGSTPLKGTNDWSLSDLEVRSPEKATAVDIRCLITGKGKVWFDELNLFEIPWE